MAAMAKRMEELKSLLEKSKSSPCSAKKKKSSSEPENENICSLKSDNKQTSSSCKSVKKESKNSSNSSQTLSKSNAVCGLKSRTVSLKTSPDSKVHPPNKTKEKQKPSFDKKVCENKNIDRHFSDQFDKKIKKTSPCQQQSMIKVAAAKQERTEITQRDNGKSYLNSIKE